MEKIKIANRNKKLENVILEKIQNLETLKDLGIHETIGSVVKKILVEVGISQEPREKTNDDEVEANRVLEKIVFFKVDAVPKKNYFFRDTVFTSNLV